MNDAPGDRFASWGHRTRWTLVCLLVAAFVSADDVPSAAHLTARDRLRIRAALDRFQFVNAERAAERALSAAETRFGKSSLAAAEAIDLLLEARGPLGRAFDARTLDLAERAVAVRTRVQGESHPDLIESLHNLVSVLRNKGDFARARQLAEQAVAIAESSLGREHATTAHCLNELSGALYTGGDVAGAMTAAERGLAVAEKVAPGDSLQVAESLNSLATTRFLKGEAKPAVPLFRRALAIRETRLGPNHPLVARTAGNLGMALRATGERNAGEQLLRRSVAIFERLNAEHVELLFYLNSLALVARSHSDYAEARRHWERALAIGERVYGVDHPNVAGVLNNLANLLKLVGDYPAAQALLERSLAIRERSRGPEHPEVAQALTNLAAVQSLTGQHARARASAERAVAIREKAHGSDSAQVGMSLSVLGETLGAAGDWDGARTAYLRAVSVMEKAGGSMDLDLANAVLGLATVRQHQADLREAGDLYQRALELFQRTLDARHPRVAETLAHLGLLTAQRGDPREAVSLALRAEEIGREHLRLTNRYLSEREGLAYAESRTHGLDLALSLAARHAEAIAPQMEQVLDALCRSRAVVMDEMTARRRRLHESADPETQKLQNEATEAGNDLAALLVRGPGKEGAAGFRASLASARERFEKAERAAAEHAAGWGGVGPAATFRSVRDALPPASALLAFARYEQVPVDGPVDARSTPSYLAIVLQPGSAPATVVRLGSGAEIDGMVTAWEVEASRGPLRKDRTRRQGEEAYRVAGRRLRTAIWDPLVPHLGPSRTIFVVPDGSLLFVQLPALPRDEGGFLIEGVHAIHTLTAEKDLLARPPQHAGTGLLAIGGAAFDRRSGGAATASPSKPASTSGVGTTTCQDIRTVRFSSLAQTSAEVEDVARVFRRGSTTRSASPAVAVLRGPGATEAAFRRLAPGRRIVHLATHGFFLGERCRPADQGGRGIGGLAPSTESGTVSRTAESPLRLAGLALAGANRRQSTDQAVNDGILTAEEIGLMDLDGVEWAVLSACDSGVGTVARGEGVLGLRRAFLSAGARTVIMSLWGVDDAAAREWMAALYQARLERGLTTADAVRTASLETLRKRRAKGQTTHPFYWAPFVAAGDWR